jgi:GAF domain-containing protein
MQTFLGAPIVLRRIPYGNLHLAEKGDGEAFSAEDEEPLLLLAAQAAVAIEMTRQREAAARRANQLESLNQIGNMLSREPELPRLLELLATTLRDLLSARIVTVWLAGPDRKLRLEAAAGEWPADLPRLTETRHDLKLERVSEHGHNERVDSLIDDPEVDQTALRLTQASAAFYPPLAAGGKGLGAIAVYDKRSHDHRFSDTDLRTAEALDDRAPT